MCEEVLSDLGKNKQRKEIKNMRWEMVGNYNFKLVTVGFIKKGIFKENLE